MKKTTLAVLILLIASSSTTLNAVPKEESAAPSVYYFVIYHLYYLSKPRGGDPARNSKKLWFVSYYDQLDKKCLDLNNSSINDDLKSQIAAEFGYLVEGSNWIMEADPKLSIETAATEKEIELKRRTRITELNKPDKDVEAYYEARGTKNPNITKVLEFDYKVLFECK